MHVNGTMFAVSGKEQKLCNMFMTEASIRRSSAGGREDIVLSHPAAKIAFERPSGTAWFSCRKGDAEAMRRATELKHKWEVVFKAMALKRGAAYLCLCPSGVCAECAGQDHIIKVNKWTVICENSLSSQAVLVEGDVKVGGKLRQMCDRYFKERKRGIPPQAQP